MKGDWPEPRFVAVKRSSQRGRRSWAVSDRVYAGCTVARCKTEYEASLLAALMEVEWLAEDARNEIAEMIA